MCNASLDDAVSHLRRVSGTLEHSLLQEQHGKCIFSYGAPDTPLTHSAHVEHARPCLGSVACCSRGEESCRVHCCKGTW